MTRVRAGGTGSNQYQTRGTPSPGESGASTASAVLSNEVQDARLAAVAFSVEGFAPWSDCCLTNTETAVWSAAEIAPHAALLMIDHRLDIDPVFVSTDTWKYLPDWSGTTIPTPEIAEWVHALTFPPMSRTTHRVAAAAGQRWYDAGTTPEDAARWWRQGIPTPADLAYWQSRTGQADPSARVWNAWGPAGGGIDFRMPAPFAPHREWESALEARIDGIRLPVDFLEMRDQAFPPGRPLSRTPVFSVDAGCAAVKLGIPAKYVGGAGVAVEKFRQTRRIRDKDDPPLSGQALTALWAIDRTDPGAAVRQYYAEATVDHLMEWEKHGFDAATATALAQSVPSPTVTTPARVRFWFDHGLGSAEITQWMTTATPDSGRPQPPRERLVDQVAIAVRRRGGSLQQANRAINRCVTDRTWG